MDSTIHRQCLLSLFQAAAAAMAKKYNPKGKTGDGGEGSEASNEDEEEGASVEDDADAKSEGTASISEAPTYVSESSGSNNEDEDSDDDSLSRAETYHSESEEGRDETPAANLTEPNDEVFTSPRQYRKAESVVSSSSASGSARGRKIERVKQQREADTSAGSHVYEVAASLSGSNEEENTVSATAKLSRFVPSF